MKTRLVAINRALYVGLVLAAAGVFTESYTVSSPIPDHATPVPVSRAEIPELRTIEPGLPSRNVFDPDGRPWRPAVREAPMVTMPAKAPAPQVRFRGLVRLGSVKGVFTDEGFVALGGDVESGRLEAVKGGTVVIRTSEGVREVPIDPDRENRRDALFANSK